MRGVEIGQSRSGALRGNQPEEPEDGKPLLRVGTRYPSLLTQLLLIHQPLISSAAFKEPLSWERERSGTKRAQFGRVAARKSVFFFCSNFLSFCPLASEYHR